MTSCDRSCVGDGGGLAETWEKELVTWCKPDGCALTLQKPEAGGNPPGTYQNPAKPGGTRRNLAEPGGTWRNPPETWRKPGGTRRQKSKLKGGGWEYNFWHGLYSQPPPPFNLLFFRKVSARFPPGFRQVPPGSAGFRRVPPGSAGFRRVPPGFAGLRRIPLGSAAPLGSARFRWVPGFRQVSSAGLCRVLPFPPTRFLLPTPPSIHC